MARRTSSITFDPTDSAFTKDPFPIYRALRDRRRAAWDELDESWLITRYEDVRRVLHDADSFSSGGGEDDVWNPEDARAWRQFELLGSDPPQHTRLRRILAKSFAPRRIAALRPVIEEHVDRLLDRGLSRGTIDVVSRLATPLPLLVTARMLGFGRGSLERLRVWSESEMAEIGPRTPPEVEQRLVGASREMIDYLRERIDEERASGRRDDNVLGDALAAEDQGRASADDVLAFLGLLVRGGTQTVTHLIGNAVLALLERRSQLEALRARPRLWANATDELARHSPPIHSVGRTVRRSVTIHGVRLRTGDRLQVVLASANRDERKFSHPDDLDFDRRTEHFAFGSGIHYCIGAQLGKLEARIAIERLLERMPLIARMEMLRPPDWQTVWAIRGLRRLPLRGGQRR